MGASPEHVVLLLQATIDEMIRSQKTPRQR
jgi:hypothetical protein